MKFRLIESFEGDDLKLDESLFDGSSIKENWCDDKLDELISKPKSEWTQDDYEAYFYCKNALAERDYYDSYDESLNGVTNMNHNLEEDWSKGLSFTFKITTNSLQNACKSGSILVGGKNRTDLSSMYSRTSLRFRIADKPYSLANDGYINVDRNESELHVNLYDKDFTYKDIGGKSNFNKAKLTQEMEELKNSIKNDLKDAGLVITQSKVEVGGSPKFNTTWRQAQKYNEDLDLSNDEDFDTYSNFNADLYNAMSDVVYNYESKGVSKKDIEKAVEWFLTHFFDNYEEDELEESKHIQKTRKKSSKLRESNYYGLNDRSEFDDDKALYNNELESGSFWELRTTPKATMGRIADILMKVGEYFVHYYGEDGEDYFNNDLLPKAVDSGVKFGIDSDKLEFVKNWFDSGCHDGEMSKKIWGESYTRKKSSKSSLSESHWDDDDDMSWLENVPLYREDHYSDNYIELNDHNIFNRLDFNGAIKTSDDEAIFYEVYTDMVNAAAEKFERITGVPIYLLGRSGRHVCVELNKENAKRFDELQDVQEKLEKEFIDEVQGFINNFELRKNGLN